MVKDKEIDANIKQSLIPIVSKEENCLREMVAEAHLEAERLITQARWEAEQRIEVAKQKSPDLVSQAHEQGIKDINAEAVRKRDICQREVAALEQTALKNLDAAVAHIVALTLPKVSL